MKAQEIRESFARYFQDRGHRKVPSSPLVPLDDPTLLFANAGMNQFKDHFTGKVPPPFKRAVTVQKCVRAGGKHNDLENVGGTPRHHTFFEMLGNFSFGDYFKGEAIAMAWEFLTGELGIPEGRLHVSVHESDGEALEIWKKTGVPEGRIVKRGDEDNFWEMGEFGPCGPCSEIFYDHGERFATPGFRPKKGGSVLDDEFRHVEIWNLVFMQYEKTPDGRVDLPTPSIDTGMGLERIAACLQGTFCNYKTDELDRIVRAVEALGDPEKDFSVRVVADHARACAMLLTDGVIPANEGRGYVLRRIIRRAVRHLREMGVRRPALHKLVPVVLADLGKEYPQNLANQGMAEEFLLEEERRFGKTLDQGLKYLEDAVAKSGGGTLPGEAAFQLHDTYGFPLDLTETILVERGMKVDTKGFREAMEERKEMGRKSWTGSAKARGGGGAKSAGGPTPFLGHETLEASAKLLEVVDCGGREALVFDRTPFYGESGGQVGDRGELRKGGRRVAEITDTLKLADGAHAHVCPAAADLVPGKKYELAVDPAARASTARNHSATHLLHAALGRVLGGHVRQAGSLVGPGRLRFDFTHPRPATPEEIGEVEELVNSQIREDLPVTSAHMGRDEALERGARALFGEKYGERVRVLEMGDFSVELCGGTHVSRTGEIGIFSVVSEAPLSAGTRRIEALTGEEALARLRGRSGLLRRVEVLTAAGEGEAAEKVQALLERLKGQRKEITRLEGRIGSLRGADLFSNPARLGDGTPFVAAEAPEGSDLRRLSDDFVGRFEGGVLLLYAKGKKRWPVLLRAGGKASRVRCDRLLGEALAEVGGRGGGRPDMAQGSGEGDPRPFAERVRGLVEAALGGAD